MNAPDYMKAWGAETEDYVAEAFLIRGTLEGEIRLYRKLPPEHLLTRRIGVEDIAIFIAKRTDLIELLLNRLIEEATT